MDGDGKLNCAEALRGSVRHAPLAHVGMSRVLRLLALLAPEASPRERFVRFGFRVLLSLLRYSGVLRRAGIFTVPPTFRLHLLV